jgi:4-amino-4-deoxychorismate lyase
MERFIESIRMVSGNLLNAEGHLLRVRKTASAHYDDIAAERLSEEFRLLFGDISLKYANDRMVRKLRIVYSDIIENYSADPYVRKTIHKVRLVHEDTIEYPFKYENRDAIDRLFAEKGDCDDIIICKNGLITDSSYSNIVISDRSGFYTPSSSLLEGCMRKLLLDEQKITSRQISVNDLFNYRYIYFVNAMRGLAENERIEIRKGLTIL